MGFDSCPEGCEFVSNPYGAVDSLGLQGLMVKDSWRPDISRYMQQFRINALYLNSARGWRGDDYSFLGELQDLVELDIIASKGSNLSVVSSLSRLRRLKLNLMTGDSVAFGTLKELRSLSLLWWPKALGLFCLPSLNYLYLEKWKAKSSRELAGLTSLSTLKLSNSSLPEISALPELKKLEEVELINCKSICDYGPLAECPSIKRLTIRGSRNLGSISFLRNLKKLEVLILSDNSRIDSLSPLSELHRLKAIALGGTTTIADGDFSHLLGLPQLSMLMFQARKHYSHKLVKKWDWRNIDSPDTLLLPK